MRAAEAMRPARYRTTHKRVLQHPRELGVTVVDVPAAAVGQSRDDVGQRRKRAVDEGPLHECLPGGARPVLALAEGVGRA